MTIWDTPGDETDESFQEYTANQYREAHAFMLCFDITNKQSFDNIKSKWINKINQYNTDCVLFLVGIKSDLKDKRTLTTEEIQEFVDTKDNISCYQEIMNKEYNNLWRI